VYGYPRDGAGSLLYMSIGEYVDKCKITMKPSGRAMLVAFGKYGTSGSVAAVNDRPLVTILHSPYKALDTVHINHLQGAFSRIVVDVVFALHLWIGTGSDCCQDKSCCLLKFKCRRSMNFYDKYILDLAKKDA
jgi:hypothetical protein